MQAQEKQLIARVLDGHAEDYGYFLEHYGQEVFALVVRLVPTAEDAEELVQDAFMRAFDRLDTFDQRSSFGTWVCRIAFNSTVSWLRQQRIKYQSIDERTPVDDRQIDAMLDDSGRAALLQEAIAQLRPDEQTLLTLYYYDEHPLSDIAYILSTEAGTLATRLHRIRKKLYLIIREYEKRKR